MTRQNLNPHRPALAAMYVWSFRYAQQRGGSMDFWESLPAHEKDLCRRLVADVLAAREETAQEREALR